MRAMRMGLALGACALLPGCIAAAIPLVAGGAIARSQLGDSPSASTATAASAPARPGGASAQVTILQGMTQLPPPSPPTATSSAPIAAYAAAQLAARPRQSALLDDPTLLVARRAPCAERPPVLLVDLDPADGLATLDLAAPADQGLAATLAELRRMGLAVAWITDHGASEARPIRARLLAAGLDPQGKDPLLVMRYPGESKQARRRALGATHCVLAIAGGGREDFDDLYLHLRDPAAALDLETMIGAGWFLIANPLD